MTPPLFCLPLPFPLCRLPPPAAETFAKHSSQRPLHNCTKQGETSIFCGYIYSLYRAFLQKRMFPAKLTESSQEDNKFFASIGYCISTGNGAATVTLEHDSSSHQNDTPKPPPVTASRWGQLFCVDGLRLRPCFLAKPPELRRMCASFVAYKRHICPCKFAAIPSFM